MTVGRFNSNGLYKKIAAMHESSEVPLNEHTGELFHYTSPTGLLGILKDNCIWASHANFLNDTSELTYGLEVAKSVIESEIENVSNPLKKLLLERTLRFTDDHNTPSYNIYVACFCEEGDLLSQWRGYASFGMGYAVGFDAVLLKKDFRPFPQMKIMFRRVEYDLDEQKRLVKSNVDNICEYFLNNLNTELNNAEEVRGIAGEVGVSIWENCKHLSLFFKDPVFSEEREWRAIYIDYKMSEERRNGKRFPVLFRADTKGITPYICMDLSPSTNGRSKKLPISSVVVGPSIRYTQATKVINMMTEEYGFDKINVIQSKIPVNY